MPLPDFRLSAVALFLAVVALGTPLGAIAMEAKRVLLLHSFGREFAPYDVVVATFRTELAKGSSEPIAFYDASLDAGNESASEDPQLLIDVLRRRFARSAPDLVVTIGPLRRPSMSKIGTRFLGQRRCWLPQWTRS